MPAQEPRTVLPLTLLAVLAMGALALLAPLAAAAHCDTLDGPVVLDARLALEEGDVTPVLKWVQKDDEALIRQAFKETQVVRAKGAEAKDLADRYFFETLVRVHRAGEGAPYTGLKPAGAVDPAIGAADKALETGSVAPLQKLIAEAVSSGLLARYSKALEASKHKDESVQSGREYVEAYVIFVHYAEGLLVAAESGGAHGASSEVHSEASTPAKPCPHGH